MATNPLIQYYEVLKNTTIWHLDDTNRVAMPEKSSKNKKYVVKAGQYVKSFGTSGAYKTQEGKQDFLILVNGNGVSMNDVKLYADNVDDCGCDGNPVAKPSDLEKLDAPVEHKKLNKESAYLGKPKKKIDKNAVVGLLFGAAIGAAVLWFSTKDKKKTIIGAVIGAFVGLIIGYFIGKRGEKKTATVDTVEQIEKQVDASAPEPVVNSRQEDQPENKEFLQLGESYDFSLPNAVYAMAFNDGTFYIAKDKSNQRITLGMGTRLKGKLVEVKEPQFFMPDPKTGKVIKIQSKKPLPFLDLGNKTYVPLAVVDPASMINNQETMDFLDGKPILEDEIYIKGRYAGKRMFNLVYFPNQSSLVAQKFSKK